MKEASARLYWRATAIATTAPQIATRLDMWVEESLVARPAAHGERATWCAASRERDSVAPRTWRAAAASAKVRRRARRKRKRGREPERENSLLPLTRRDYPRDVSVRPRPLSKTRSEDRCSRAIAIFSFSREGSRTKKFFSFVEKRRDARLPRSARE